MLVNVYSFTFGCKITIFFSYMQINLHFSDFFAPSTPSLCRSCVPSYYPIQPQNKTQIRLKWDHLHRITIGWNPYFVILQLLLYIHSIYTFCFDLCMSFFFVTSDICLIINNSLPLRSVDYCSQSSPRSYVRVLRCIRKSCVFCFPRRSSAMIIYRQAKKSQKNLRMCNFCCTFAPDLCIWT